MKNKFMKPASVIMSVISGLMTIEVIHSNHTTLAMVWGVTLAIWLVNIKLYWTAE